MTAMADRWPGLAREGSQAWLDWAATQLPDDHLIAMIQ